MAFKQAVTQVPLTTNDNGGLAYEHTGDPRVDLFFAARDTPVEKINKNMEESWSISPLDTVRLVMRKRDCRGGEGEKDLFYNMCVWLLKYHPDTMAKNMHLVSKYGYYKDYAKLAVLYPEFLQLSVKEFAEDLKKDRELHESGATVGYTFAAKYAPSRGHHFDKECREFIPLLMKELGYKNKKDEKYRKLLSALRERLNVVERKMCSGDWKDIDFSKVPSKALNQYKKCFPKHAQWEWECYLNDVETGKKKMNVAQLQPHELGKYYTSGWHFNNLPEDQATEMQWAQFVENTAKTADFTDCVAIPDVSGSMQGMPMQVSITLGALVAKVAARQGSPFGNLIMTFSENPTFHDLGESPKLRDCVKQIFESGSTGMNTDLYKVFEQAIKRARSCKVAPKDFLKRVIVFSDMHFDAATKGYYNTKLTPLEKIDELFNDCEYERPTVVFWNLAGNASIPATVHEKNVAMVSGFSASTFQAILKGEDLTPYGVMRNAIDNGRYDEVCV